MSNALNQEHVLHIARVLKEWVEWVDAGQPVENPGAFNPSVGLCMAITNHPSTNYQHYEFPWEIATCLRGLFRKDGLETTYPFSESRDFPYDVTEYDHEGDTATMHENPRRMAWARKIAALVP